MNVMLCEKCKKNEATTYIRTNVNGDVHEYHLCPECAAEMQQSGAFGKMMDFGSFDPFGAFGSFGGLLGGGFDMVSSLLSAPFGSFGVQGSMPSLGTAQRCPVCGSDFGSIARSGKAGCPNCYNEFRSRLAPTVKQIHGNTAHCGKHSKVTIEQSYENELAALRHELADAVGSENYEKAAQLRDKIKELESRK